MRILKKAGTVAGIIAAISTLSAGAVTAATSPETVTSPTGKVTCTITEGVASGGQAFTVTCSGTTVHGEHIYVDRSCNTGSFITGIHGRSGTLNDSTETVTYAGCGPLGFKFIRVRFEYNVSNG